MRISDWSSDVCSSDLNRAPRIRKHRQVLRRDPAVRGESGDHVGTPARKRAIHKARRITLGGGKAQPVGIAHRRPFGTFEEFEVRPQRQSRRSEAHPSELQSLMRISYAVFCLKTENTSHSTSPLSPS